MNSFSAKWTGVVTLALGIALASCASGSAPGGGAAPKRGPSDRITPQELEQDAGLDLYTIVERLRPQWLQVRGGVTAQGRASIAIFLDGVRQQGSIEVMRSMKGSDVQELRFMNARDATTRYGTDMAAGAIQIITKH